MATKSTSPFQVMRSLTTDEFRTLKASIVEHGILEPILLDPEGNIVDGHHRMKVAKQLGIEPPTRVLEGFTQEELLAKAHTLNRARRHLSQAEQREFIAEHLSAEPGAANREIARRVGCDDKTVAAVRKDMIEKGELDAEEAKRTRKPKKTAEPAAEKTEAAEQDSADEATFTCEGCGKHKPVATQLNEVDGKNLCESCADGDDTAESPRLPDVEAPQFSDEPVDEDGFPLDADDPATLFDAVSGRLSRIIIDLQRVATDLEGSGLTADEWLSIRGQLGTAADTLGHIVVPE